MIDANDQYNVASKQRILLSMMVDFHDFCTKMGIAYTIIGGTLLGAIREKGFIPWDDDIDILMDRANFELLRSELHKMPQYSMEEPLWVYKFVDKDVYHQQGINKTIPVLDIFIADRVQSGIFKKKIKVLGLKLLQGMIKTKTNEKKKYSVVYYFALKVTSIVGKLFSADQKKKMYTSLSLWGNADSTQPLMICNDIFQSLGCEYAPDLMDEFILLDFEDTKLMAIKKWDNYLTKQYGDYMRPVRIEH